MSCVVSARRLRRTRLRGGRRRRSPDFRRVHHQSDNELAPRPTSNFVESSYKVTYLVLMPIKVLIRFVDGSAMEHSVDDADLARLVAFERDGLTGMALIHAWLSDDWGAPPIDITIQGVTARGQHINRTLFYD
jgi:hypothetical protein